MKIEIDGNMYKMMQSSNESEIDIIKEATGELVKALSQEIFKNFDKIEDDNYPNIHIELTYKLVENET